MSSQHSTREDDDVFSFLLNDDDVPNFLASPRSQHHRSPRHRSPRSQQHRHRASSPPPTTQDTTLVHLLLQNNPSSTFLSEIDNLDRLIETRPTSPTSPSPTSPSPTSPRTRSTQKKRSSSPPKNNLPKKKTRGRPKKKYSCSVCKKEKESHEFGKRQLSYAKFGKARCSECI